MIEDPATGHVLVQDRLLSFIGLAFPGGHVEDSESVYDCAVREVFEETGLCVRNLQSCGFIHYCCEEDQSRYMVFLYKTREFSGELIPEMVEGRHFWMPVEEFKQHQFTNRFWAYLPMFFGDQGHNEAFCLWPKDSEERNFVYL